MSTERSGDSACCHSESPATKIIEKQVSFSPDVRVYDPFVPSVETRTGVFTSVTDFYRALTDADCAILLVDPDLFRKTPPGLFAEVMDSPGVGERACLSEEGLVYLGIEKENEYAQ